MSGFYGLLADISEADMFIQVIADGFLRFAPSVHNEILYFHSDIIINTPDSALR